MLVHTDETLMLELMIRDPPAPPGERIAAASALLDYHIRDMHPEDAIAVLASFMRDPATPPEARALVESVNVRPA